jgi:hypothetical protein
MNDVTKKLPRRTSLKGYSLIVGIVLLISGIVCVAAGIPLLKGKIESNCIYGFRVQKTLANEDIWYQTNKYFGREVIISGAIVILFSVIIFFFCGKMKPLWLILSVVFLPYIPLIIAIIRTLLFLRKL